MGQSVPMARTSLLPGFRFHPTDVELIMYYLKRKVLGKKLHADVIAEVNIYKFSPWELKGKSCLRSEDLKWFFFCPIEKKYASGSRIKRTTQGGFWKATGKDREITYHNRLVGKVKSLVFHLGQAPKGKGTASKGKGTAPKGKGTNWVIHEYRIIDEQLAASGVQDTYVLCKVFEKPGPGPKNGAQYGAPFNEEDWTDNDIDDTQNPDVSSISNVPSQTSPTKGDRDVLPGSKEPVADENTLPFKENEIPQEDPSGNKSTPCSDGREIYNDLSDLDDWSQKNKGRLDSLGLLNNDYSGFIELNDLLSPLPCSAGAAGTDQSLDGQIFGHYVNENMEQFYPEGSFVGMDQYAPCATQLPLLPGGENCFEVLQMEDPSGNKSTPCSDQCEIYNVPSDVDDWSQMNNGRLDSLGLLNNDYSGFIELNDLLSPLPCSAGAAGTDQSLDGQIFGHYVNENMEQFYPEGSFVGMDQYAPCATQLPLLPGGENCFEVLQMGDNQLYCGSTADHLDFASIQPESGVKFTEYMGRASLVRLHNLLLMSVDAAGTPKKICMSRLNPARPLSAAARSLCCGGSSTHIKAEVTHGAGECTNEALLLMMGGSGSCSWCILAWAVFQELCYLIYLVEFDPIQVLICCCLNEMRPKSDSWSYYCHC